MAAFKIDETLVNNVTVNIFLSIVHLQTNYHCRDCKVVPVKVSNISAETTTSTRVIDTGGGFLIEESTSGKHPSLTTKVVYDPGTVLLFEYCKTLNT